VIPVHCEGCGLTIHPGAMRRDLGYLVARSCPRCARPLSPPHESRHESREAQGRRRKQLATALPDTYQGNYTRRAARPVALTGAEATATRKGPNADEVVQRSDQVVSGHMSQNG
jgi:hypothetical protein